MPIVHPSVESPQLLADLLAWPASEGPINRIQIERSATGGGVGYSNIGSVTLAADTLEYTFYDVNGVASSWYRWYFSNAANTFPLSANREYSTETQPAAEDDGLICSLGNVKQRLDIGASDDDDDELLLDIARQVTADIQGYTKRRFVRSPMNGTTTFLFDVRQASRTLWVVAGIASMTTLEVATQTGGAFTTVPTTDWFLDPPEQDRDFGWPATRVTISDVPSGSIPFFYPGKRVVRGTMAIGWETIPSDVAGIGEAAVVRRWKAKQSGQADIVGASEFGSRTLRFISPEERERLDWYAYRPV